MSAESGNPGNGFSSDLDLTSGLLGNTSDSNRDALGNPIGEMQYPLGGGDVSSSDSQDRDVLTGMNSQDAADEFNMNYPAGSSEFETGIPPVDTAAHFIGELDRTIDRTLNAGIPVVKETAVRSFDTIAEKVLNWRDRALNSWNSPDNKLHNQLDDAIERASQNLANQLSEDSDSPLKKGVERATEVGKEWATKTTKAIKSGQEFTEVYMEKFLDGTSPFLENHTSLEPGTQSIEPNQSNSDILNNGDGTLEILGQNDVLSGEYYSVNVDEILESAVSSARQQLSTFLGDREFASKIEKAFGDRVSPELAHSLIQDFASGSVTPEVDIVDFKNTQTNGSFGAGIIALSRQFLLDNADRSDLVASVLLEELGHYLDAEVGQGDASGDEGRIFAKLVRGETIDDNEFARLKTEDDRATITLNGQEIEMEQSSQAYAYTIQSGDTLWEIAERELGDGNRWREIRKSDGSSFSEEEARRLQIGEDVYIPETEPEPVAESQTSHSDSPEHSASVSSGTPENRNDSVESEPRDRSEDEYNSNRDESSSNSNRNSPTQNSTSSNVEPPATNTTVVSSSPKAESDSTYTIQSGDTLWEIAERQLGDGNRWQEIRKPDGTIFSEQEAEALRIGQVVVLPDTDPSVDDSQSVDNTSNSTSENAVSSETPTQSNQEITSTEISDSGSQVTYTIKSGDTLSDIAERELGDGKRWHEIRKPDGSYFTEEEARQLQPGEVVVLPETDSSTELSQNADNASQNLDDGSNSVSQNTVSSESITSSSPFILIRTGGEESVDELIQTILDSQSSIEKIKTRNEEIDREIKNNEDRISDIKEGWFWQLFPWNHMEVSNKKDTLIILRSEKEINNEEIEKLETSFEVTVNNKVNKRLGPGENYSEAGHFDKGERLLLIELREGQPYPDPDDTSKTKNIWVRTSEDQWVAAAYLDLDSLQKTFKTPVQTNYTGEISEAGLEFIAKHEGKKLKPYNDSSGYCTIGFGHLIYKKPCNGSEPVEFRDGITEEKAKELLKEDITQKSKDVKDLVKVPLSQHQFDALVSFTFNLGKGSLEKSELLEKLNAGDYHSVPDELKRWNKGRDKDGTLREEPGLTKRREQEGILFRDGIYT